MLSFITIRVSNTMSNRKGWKFKELKIVNNDDMNNCGDEIVVLFARPNRKFNVLCISPHDKPVQILFQIQFSKTLPRHKGCVINLFSVLRSYDSR